METRGEVKIIEGNKESLVAERHENIRGESNIIVSWEKILGVSHFWKSTPQYTKIITILIFHW